MTLDEIMAKIMQPPHTANLDEVKWLMEQIHEQQKEIVAVQDLCIKRGDELIALWNKHLAYVKAHP